MATAEYNGFDAPSDGVWADDKRATAGWSTADEPVGMEIARGARFPANWQIASDFDPNDHMMQLKGRDYLNVQARLLWFIRDQRALTVAGLARMPYAVRTELVEMDRAQGWAHFRTYVRDVLGNEATMYGSESAKDFADFAEKASTKSVGRALLALGYGTAFAPEMDEGDRVVDAPVERARPVQPRPQPQPQPQPAPRTAPPAATSTPSGTLSITDFCKAVKAELGITPKQAMEKLGVKSLDGINLNTAMLKLHGMFGVEQITPEERASIAAIIEPDEMPAPAPAAAAGEWIALGDPRFVARCSAIGWRSIANVEELLAAADATRADGESLRDAAYRYLDGQEEMARLAAAAVGKRGN